MEKTCTILIIEDDPDIGNMIRMILEYKGYTVLVLKSAGSVNKFMKDNRIDLVIMDMLLSGANGTDICMELKRDVSRSHIPLIMMSAHPDAESMCRNAGADDFVSKPFDLDDLLLKIGHYTGPQTILK